MRILITAGPTREYIDPVRFISNASSGKMGLELVRAALNRHHDVILVMGPVCCVDRLLARLYNRSNLELIRVESADQMYRAVMSEYDRVDAVIMAAAVADYRPRRQYRYKRKKSDRMVLELVKTPDILKELGKIKKDKTVLAGFALEDRTAQKNAIKKFKEKNLDIIVLNFPAAIGADRAEVGIYTRTDGWIYLKDASKRTVAARLIRLIEKIYADKGSD